MTFKKLERYRYILDRSRRFGLIAFCITTLIQPIQIKAQTENYESYLRREFRYDPEKFMNRIPPALADIKACLVWHDYGHLSFWRILESQIWLRVFWQLRLHYYEDIDISIQRIMMMQNAADALFQIAMNNLRDLHDRKRDVEEHCKIIAEQFSELTHATE